MWCCPMVLWYQSYIQSSDEETLSDNSHNTREFKYKILTQVVQVYTYSSGGKLVLDHGGPMLETNNCYMTGNLLPCETLGSKIVFVN